MDYLVPIDCNLPVQVHGSPEGRPFVEHIRNDHEGDEGKSHSNNSTCENIHGVVEIVTDSCQADPEGEDDHGKLDEGSEDLESPVDYSNWSTLVAGEVTESCLEINNEKHPTVEAE